MFRIMIATHDRNNEQEVEKDTAAVKKVLNDNFVQYVDMSTFNRGANEIEVGILSSTEVTTVGNILNELHGIMPSIIRDVRIKTSGG